MKDTKCCMKCDVENIANTGNTKDCMKLNPVYAVETTKHFPEAVVSVLKAVEQKGWALFNVIDLQERLAAKGFPHKALKVIEICSAKHANKLLTKNRLTSLCMPCRISVFEENEKNGSVNIAGMKPSLLPQFFPEVKEEDIVEAERELKEIIDLALKL